MLYIVIESGDMGEELNELCMALVGELLEGVVRGSLCELKLVCSFLIRNLFSLIIRH